MTKPFSHNTTMDEKDKKDIKPCRFIFTPKPERKSNEVPNPLFTLKSTQSTDDVKKPKLVYPLKESPKTTLQNPVTPTVTRESLNALYANAKPRVINFSPSPKEKKVVVPTNNQNNSTPVRATTMDKEDKKDIKPCPIIFGPKPERKSNEAHAHKANNSPVNCTLSTEDVKKHKLNFPLKETTNNSVTTVIRESLYALYANVKPRVINFSLTPKEKKVTNPNESSLHLNPESTLNDGERLESSSILVCDPPSEKSMEVDLVNLTSSNSDAEELSFHSCNGEEPEIVSESPELVSTPVHMNARWRSHNFPLSPPPPNHVSTTNLLWRDTPVMNPAINPSFWNTSNVSISLSPKRNLPPITFQTTQNSSDSSKIVVRSPVIAFKRESSDGLYANVKPEVINCSLVSPKKEKNVTVPLTNQNESSQHLNPDSTLNDGERTESSSILFRETPLAKPAINRSFWSTSDVSIPLSPEINFPQNTFQTSQSSNDSVSQYRSFVHEPTLEEDSQSDEDMEKLGETLLGIHVTKRSKPSAKSAGTDATRPNLSDANIANTSANVHFPQALSGSIQKAMEDLNHIISRMPSPSASDKLEDDLVPPGLTELYGHQKYGLKWLWWRENEFPGGGILADEMGLGKTIMIIALVTKSKHERFRKPKETFEIEDKIPSQSTLVVCPTGCMLQWNKEILSKSELKCTVYHGSQRHKTHDIRKFLKTDIVVTTYGTVTADHSNCESPLFKIGWHRVVLDEAHIIRNHKTKGAEALCDLTAEHRWAVTGTPVHNNASDMYSLIKFLQMNPFDDQRTWKVWIGMKAIHRRTEATTFFQTIAQSLLLRREKNQGDIPKIPPKTVELVEIDLSEEERRVYDHLMEFSQSLFQNFLEEKKKRDMELKWNAYRDRERVKASGISFSHIFALILRLRQCAVLPHLIETMLEDEEADDNSSFDEYKMEHIISKRNPIFDPYFKSSKVEKILEDLKSLQKTAELENRAMDKVVIVSSWTSILDILNQHIREMGLQTVFITGREDVETRNANMIRFNRPNKRPHVCLLSLTAGGVGINLIGGNYAFFVEPHWNPQIELQAQDRVHRLGQTKNVIIRRYISKDSIESRVMKLQENKLNLAGVILNNAKKSGNGLSIQKMRVLFGV